MRREADVSKELVVLRARSHRLKSKLAEAQEESKKFEEQRDDAVRGPGNTGRGSDAGRGARTGTGSDVDVDVDADGGTRAEAARRAARAALQDGGASHGGAGVPAPGMVEAQAALRERE